MRFFLKTLLSTLLILPLYSMAGPLVNLNTADEHELVTDLTGVNDKTASAIVEYRDKNGSFSKLEDVLNVEGVGRDFININRDYIHLGNDPRLDQKS